MEIPSNPSKLHQGNQSFTSSQDNVHGIATLATGYLDGLSVSKTAKNITIQYWEHLTLLYCNHNTSAQFFKKSIRLSGLLSRVHFSFVVILASLSNTQKIHLKNMVKETSVTDTRNFDCEIWIIENVQQIGFSTHCLDCAQHLTSFDGPA